MRDGIKRKYMLIASFLCVWFVLPGCAVTKQMGDPDKVLLNAVSGISGEANFAFKGKTEVSAAGRTLAKPLFVEGFVAGHKRMVLKTRQDARPDHKSRAVNELSGPIETVYYTKNKQWVQAGAANKVSGHVLQDGNPVMKLEQVIKMKRRVSVNSQKSNGDVIVLDIDLDPVKMKSALQVDLRQQQTAIDPEQFIRSAKARTALTPAQEQRLRSELSAQLRRSNRELGTMLKTLHVQARSELMIDRVSSLPIRLKSVTTMTYRLQGADRKETTSTNYVFKDYGKPFTVPQRGVR